MALKWEGSKLYCTKDLEQWGWYSINNLSVAVDLSHCTDNILNGQRMLRYLLLLLLTLNSGQLRSQAWQWQMGMYEPDQYGTTFNTSCTDHEGNTYIPIQRGGQYLLDAGSNFRFYSEGIVKVSPAGKVKWHLPVLGIRDNRPYISQIKLSASGQLFVAGTYYEERQFGNDILTSKGVPGRDINFYNFFVASADTSGHWLRAKGFGYASRGSLQSMEIGKDGSIYVSGSYMDSINIGGVRKQTRGVVADNIILLKISADYTLQWLKEFGADLKEERISCLTLDEEDNIYFAAGYSLSSALQAPQYLFIHKYDKSGKELKRKQMGFKDPNNGYRRAVISQIFLHKKKEIYIKGYYSEATDFGDGLYRKPKFRSVDQFIARYDTAFNLKKFYPLDCTKGGTQVIVVQDDSSNLYLGGYIRDTFYVNGVRTAYPIGTNDGLYFLKFSPDMELLWKSVPFLSGKPVSSVQNLTKDGCGNLYVAGTPTGSNKIPGVRILLKDTLPNPDSLYSFSFLAKLSSYILPIRAEYHCDSIRLWVEDTSLRSIVWQTDQGQKKYGKQVFFCLPSAGEKLHLWVHAYRPKGCEVMGRDSFSRAVPPRAKFHLQKTEACQWTKVILSDSSSSDSVNASAGESWVWDFGDGSTAITSKAPIKIYTKPGRYNIRLIYSNGFCKDTAYDSITVISAPKPGFSLSNTEGCAPLTVQANYNKTPDVLAIEYQSGDGQVAVKESASFSYITPGTYWLVQRLTGITGCITSDSQQIIVRPGLSASVRPEIRFATLRSDSQVYMQWVPVSGATGYLLEKYMDDTLHQVSSHAFSANVLDWSDSNVSPSAHAYHYRLKAIDTCGNSSGPGNWASSILLKASRRDNSEVELNWTPYLQWSSAPVYEIQYSDFSGDTVQNLASLPGHSNTYTDANFWREGAEGICYRVRAVGPDSGQQTSLSNRICLSYLPEIWLPNSFTPNGDGMNDVFSLRGINIRTLDLRIYSRWGECVFSCNNSSCSWDGMYKETAVPSGVYFYRITVEYVGGEKVFRSGNITLNR